jgi:hypothetical protein
MLEAIPASVWIGLSALSALMFFGSLVALRFLIVRMPADYFSRERRAARDWLGSHPAMRALGTIVKNVVGLVLLVVGVIMLFTPGQGILLILVGVSLLDIPGKHAVQLRIVRNPAVLRAINRIRANAGHLPIVLDEQGDEGERSAQGTTRG